MGRSAQLFHHTSLQRPSWPKRSQGDYDSAREGKLKRFGLAQDFPFPERGVQDNIMSKRNRLLSTIPWMVLTCLLTISAPLTGQERVANPQPNTVWVGADGKFESEPDTALVQFNISAQEEKLQDANDRATRAAEQVRQLLRANGIDPKDAQVGRFAVQPVYDYKNPKRKLVGYRVDTDISVKVKDFSKVGPIAEGLANMDVTSNQSITYQLDDMDAAKIKAVEDALRRARDEANAVARSIPVKTSSTSSSGRGSAIRWGSMSRSST